MEKQELLSIGDLNVWYTEGTPVLNHFSMDLFRNEVVGLIGLNGAGKTTLIKTVSLAKGFHFEEYADVLMKELSTGNRKKAYLIAAFALHPELLLLDEPVNGLDFQSTEFLYRMINDYRSYGSVLFSSHILESICLTSDRVLVLEHGRIGNSFSGDGIRAETIREVLGE